MSKTDPVHPAATTEEAAAAALPNPPHFPPNKHPHLVEVSTKGAPLFEREGKEPIAALYSRQDVNTGKIFDYYPRYRIIDTHVPNGMGGLSPAKKKMVTLVRRARRGQRDPFASMGVRATGEVK